MKTIIIILGMLLMMAVTCRTKTGHFRVKDRTTLFTSNGVTGQRYNLQCLECGQTFYHVENIENAPDIHVGDTCTMNTYHDCN